MTTAKRPSFSRCRLRPRLVLAPLLLLAMASPLLAQADLDRVFGDPRVRDGARLEALYRSGVSTLPVIVSLRTPADVSGFSDWRSRPLAQQHRARVAALQGEFVGGLPQGAFSLRHRLENHAIVAADVTLDGLAALLARPELLTVEHDGIVEAHTEEGIALMNAEAIRSEFDGSGRSIAIVDTGIDYNHEALGGGGFPNGKVIGGFDFGDWDTNPLDLSGHGTSVAGIAAGDVVAGAFSGGVAPGAKLYALKIVVDGSGSADLSKVMLAWDWCLTHQDDDPANPIMVVNTSFGGGKYVAPSPAYETTASSLVSAGITIFCSSGNDGWCDAMANPAAAPSAISVGSVYDASLAPSAVCVNAASCVAVPEAGCTSANACFDLAPVADLVTCYSNSTYFLDLLAPAEDAVTASMGGGYTQSFGGTSSASPYAAGAGAVLLHAAEASGHPLTPEEVRAVLIATGDPVVDAKAGLTFPRVNLGVAASHYVATWVDFAHSGTELGTYDKPFNTLAEGIAAVTSGGSLRVLSGATLESPTISKALVMEAEGGSVTIGG